MHCAEELRIHVPWGYVAAKAWGKPYQTPVLAIHGFHDNAASFDQLVPLLGNQCYIVCVDLPGHGFSSHYPPGIYFSFLDFVCDLKRVTDHLKWDQFTILCHSLGSHVGLYFAALFPTLLQKVVMIDMFLAHIIPDDNFIIERCQVVMDKLFASEIQDSIFKQKIYTYEDAFGKLCDERYTKLSKVSAEALLNRSVSKVKGGYVFNHDRRLNLLSHPLITLNFHLELMKGIKCSILIVSTSEFEHFLSTPTTKRTLTELRAGLGSKLKFVKVEGSHDSHMDRPNAIASEVKMFLSCMHSKM